MISWAEGVISVAEPPITSDGLESGVVFGAVIVLLDSPSHTTDGLNSLSKNILVGTGTRLAPMGGGYPPLDCFLGPHGGIRAPRTELTF